MRRLALLLCLLCAVASAAPPTLTLPKEVSGDPGTFIAIRAESDAAWVNFKADQGLAVFPSGLLSDKKATVVTARVAGRYKLFAYTGNQEGGVDAEVIIIVGDPPPVPPGPTPPGPNPPPVPIPTDGFRVLFIEETSKRSELSSRQLEVINSTLIREYLNRKCAKGPDGKTPEYRFIDQDETFAKESETWQKILAATKPQVKELPAMVVINGSAGEVLPITRDATENTILAALKQRGGE